MRNFAFLRISSAISFEADSKGSLRYNLLSSGFHVRRPYLYSIYNFYKNELLEKTMNYLINRAHVHRSKVSLLHLIIYVHASELCC